MKTKFIMAAFAALAMLASCSKEDGDGKTPGGDSAKTVDLTISVKLPEDAAEAIKSVDIKADKAIFAGSNTISIELTEGAVVEDVINMSATVLADGPTKLLMSFNAPETPHTVFTSYVELGADALAAAKLEVDATMSDYHAGKPTCEGTQADPYLIADKYQLQAIQMLSGSDAHKYFELLNDIDVEDVLWISVDGPVILNGNGKTISHLSAPLFENLNGQVTDLTIADANVTCAETAGILARTANDETIVTGVKLVRDTLNVAATELCYVGMLVGEVASASTFDDCHIESSHLTTVATNKPYYGGAFGYVHNDDAKIGGTKGCTIDATSTLSMRDYAGGFIGVLDGGSVMNIEVKCPTEGYSRFGGIVGQMKNGLLDGNSFTGTLTGGYQNVGGLVGEMLDGTVKNCSATSGVTYKSAVRYAIVGGLVGNMVAGSIEKCFATGRVEANGRPVGGLVGQITGIATISKSYTCVDVEQLSTDGTYGRFTGGFIGQVSSSANVEISNCYATGSVTNKNNYNGAFVGCIDGTVDITNCYTKCKMSGNSAYSTTVFAGSVADSQKVTLKGFIGWDISEAKTANVWWFQGPESITGNKLVTDLEAGTISFDAMKLKWDVTVWDLSEDDPVLR